MGPRRLLFGAVLVAVALVVPVLAGNAHFVGTPKLTESGDIVTASGKVAGLGNIPQIHVELSGDCACINGGSHNPSAENKDDFSVGGDFPVQNGKAEFSLDLLATFQPSCNPPMSVDWSNVLITVTAADGTFLQYPN